MESEENKMTYHKLEEEYFGISHAEVGGRLLDSWMFPPEITEAVAFHHKPSVFTKDPVFVACVHIADLLCTVKGISPLKEYYFLTIEKSILPVLQGLKENVSTDDLVSLIPQIDLEIDRQSNLVSSFR